MKRKSAQCLAGAVLFFAALAAAGERKVLIISVDGTRPDALLAADCPNLDALRAQGAWSLRGSTAVYPVSGQSYSSMFTGAWPAKHKVSDNDFSAARFDLYPNFLCRLQEADPAYVTQSIVRWAPLDPNLFACADYHTAPSSDAKALEEALALLRTTDPDGLFVHFEDADTAGHASGFSATSAQYLAAIASIDGRVGAILETLRARPRFADEEWLVIALSDHGGAAKDHHADTPENRTIFMIFDGGRVTPGEIDPPPAVVDVAVTAMTYLGLPVDPAWDLDGRVVALRTEPAVNQLPSDCNQDGALDIADVVCVLGYLFAGDPVRLPCGDGTLDGPSGTLLDANASGYVDLSDAVYLLMHLFGNHAGPVLGTTCVLIEGCPAACR